MIIRLVGSFITALAVVIGVEAAFGPFGNPYDGLFGIAAGIVCLFCWFAVIS